ncbi:MAG: ATPase, T2SS/T4P/T4SS family [Elusimicrobiota bacterium]
MSDKTFSAKILSLLLERRQISLEQFEEIEKEQAKAGVSIGRLLLQKNILPEKEFAQLISEGLNIPYVDLSFYVIDQEIISLVPEETARQFKLIPLYRIKDTLTVAFADPLDIIGIDDLKIRTNCSILVVISTETEIVKAINQFYRTEKSIEDLIGPLQEKQINFENEDKLTAAILFQLADDPPIIKFVNQIIVKAVKEKASDIHIETNEANVKIRYRIDGILQDIMTINKSVGVPLIPRLKILASLDITERRKPQDGRFSMSIENRKIDFRISIFPMAYGEKVVVRILDKDSAILDLGKTGLPAEILTKFERLIKLSYGVVLVTGPTGSGKTTTLYAGLAALNSREKNILTIEDPIEYVLPGINQAQVNPKIGLDFAAGLRSFLRQDPDIIMVGEIRDGETAQIAMRAAQTGHLVLSSLHTNDACGAITRLVDMGIEPFLAASSVVGVLGQRLIRVICPECKKEHKLEAEDKEKLRKEAKLLGIDVDKISVYKGKGCFSCKHTGYKGRTTIVELLVVDQALKKIIIQKPSHAQIFKVAQEQGMISIREDGLKKVFHGITTLDEVLLTTQACQD